MTDITFEITKHGNDYDHDDVKFYRDNKQVGSGFIAHNNEGVGLDSCPECGKMNYPMNVSTGICTWCGFDINKEMKA